ncbi:MAG: molybdopterin-dependent oxidoreductase [Promethearchaeota archaeon]
MTNWVIKPVLISVLLFITFGNVLIKVKVYDEIPITPNDEFFTTSIDYFDINPDDYRLVVMGEVRNPLNLSLAEIKVMPVTSEIVRLTCVDYISGATSLTGVANWTGVRLSHILNLAQIKYFSTKDIIFHTPDLSKQGYSTSLNLTEAFWGDVILAYEMNEEPLPTTHGFPIRLVCPRFYGYKWIKWVAYINVSSKDYEGFWESWGYEDSPYVFPELPIYYSPVGSDITAFSLTSGKSSHWSGVIVPIVATIVLTFCMNYRKKKLS